MTTFKVSSIKWDTEDSELTAPDNLPESATVEADDEEDVVEELTKEYNWCVLSCSIVPDSVRVELKWRNDYHPPIILHPDITESEARELCSHDLTSGEDSKGNAWMMVWYHN